MKKYFIYIIIGSFFILINCIRKRDNPLDPKAINYIGNNPTPTEWETIFSDNFNRADTTNASLGNDWKVILSSSNSVIKITNNIVTMVNGALAYYTNRSFNNILFRVIMKFKSTQRGKSDICLMHMVDGVNGRGYAAGISTNNIMSIIRMDNQFQGPVIQSSSVELATNITYFLEFEYNNLQLSLCLKNAYGNLIKSISKVDGTYTAGQAGFYGSTTNAGTPFAIDLDDFLVQKPTEY